MRMVPELDYQYWPVIGLAKGMAQARLIAIITRLS